MAQALVGEKLLLFSRILSYSGIGMGSQTKNSHWNSVAGVLRTVFPDSAEPEKLRAYRAWEVWPEVVGPANAKRAQPTKLRNGKLFVTVLHPALMQELQFVKERIRRHLNRLLGAEVITHIYFGRGPIRQGDVATSPPPQRTLPQFHDVAIPPVDNPEIRGAFESLLTARRRRLAKPPEDD